MWRASRAAAAWIGAGAALALAAAIASRWPGEEVQCDDGFRKDGAACAIAEGACPSPLAVVDGHCVAPQVVVHIPAARFVVGPSDWEAEGRVTARTVITRAFAIDAFEVTRDAKPVASLSRDEADALCKERGGRLPTEDEWIAAASSGAPNGNASRYPWGETGAVCRRASWGASRGPCASGGKSPGVVGAHKSGDTALGVHDMAGSVAEWVAASNTHPNVGVAHGGSWSSELATELRTWSRLEVAPDTRDSRIGVRCAYDDPP